MEKIILTRQELYDLVWENPLSKLAKKYNLSDNGLRKVCKKLDIPLPKNGHWQKIQFNKKVINAYSDETVHPIPGQTEQLFL